LINSYLEIQWSQLVESVHKDIKCTFGILKGQYWILKYGIQLQSVDACDKIWYTCCTLHNWLVDIDGYNFPWDGELGLFKEMKWRKMFLQLHNTGCTPAARCAYNTSGMGRGNYVDRNNNDADACQRCVITNNTAVPSWSSS